MKWNREEIERILPHRAPMLLVTTVEELEPGKQVRGTYWVDPQQAIFQGHFPDDPVFPGVYTVECMAQATDIVLLSTRRYAGKTPLFLGIDRVSFQRKILPGDTIELRAEVVSERPDKAIATCAAEACIHGEVAARGLITIAMR